MEKMKDLKDLLTHEIQDLYSVEEQIIKAMPLMIEKSKNAELTKALKEHLRITEEQKNRLDKVKAMLAGSSSELPGVGEESDSTEGTEGTEKKGFFSGLFGGHSGSQVCKGMSGIIEEGEKVMNEDMNPEVLDAAIIASAQKIEHYEICGYGTARAFAIELNLRDVADLLNQTLEEEYNADELLTELAVGKLNEVAEGRRSRRSTQGGRSASKSGNNKSAARSNSGSRPKAASKKTAKKSAPAKKGTTKKAAPKKAAPRKAAAKKAAPKKAAAKKGPAKSAGKSSGGRGSNKSAKSASTRNLKSPGGRAGTARRGTKGR